MVSWLLHLCEVGVDRFSPDIALYLPLFAASEKRQILIEMRRAKERFVELEKRKKNSRSKVGF